MKILSKSYIALILAILYVPILVLMLFSFNSTNNTGVLTGFSLYWYRELFRSAEAFNALKNTLILAVSSAAISTVIGTAATLLAAYFTWKFRDRKVSGIPVLSILMPVVFNFFFVGAELAYLFMPDSFITGLFINGFFVAVGEIVACTLGYILVRQLAKKDIFKE
jgi:ABC-type spermidine/putrescine transport system permease subunit II